ncbi:MAG: type II toxin-antitoxin system HicA family toxin [Steroidobacteraceae bacterium]
MKRRDLIRHLERNGCELLREGGRHSVYVNRACRKVSAVPRHTELNEIAAGWRQPLSCPKSLRR